MNPLFQQLFLSLQRPVLLGRWELIKSRREPGCDFLDDNDFRIWSSLGRQWRNKNRQWRWKEKKNAHFLPESWSLLYQRHSLCPSGCFWTQKWANNIISILPNEWISIHCHHHHFKKGSSLMLPIFLPGILIWVNVNLMYVMVHDSIPYSHSFHCLLHY